MAFSADRLRQRAVAVGFNLVGVTPAVASPTLAAYFAWVDAGMHGSMGYMARPDRQARRADLSVILPGVRSLVVVGMDYRDSVPPGVLEDAARGRFASYAWGLDYHDVMTPRLRALAEWLRAESGQALSHRVYVDTGAILERSHAHAAGLGFVGKNTMLIHPRRGSYLFLGEILTDLEFDDYDTPGAASRCGTCTRCLTACPTGAFPRPFVLDARRCISYLTIEHKGWIPVEFRSQMGNWVYGCDVCQDVCPWQRFAPRTQEPAFRQADVNRVAPMLCDLLALDDATFSAWYGGSAAARVKRERLVRNACVAAGNWGSPQAAPMLVGLLNDASPIVRGHAAWALAQIEGDDASPLRRLREREADSAVQAELARLAS